MYFVSYGASYIKSNASFRLPWGLQMIPAIILFCCLPSMPRSPRWLASQDRWEEAVSTLAILRSGGDVENAEVIAEMQEIRDRVQYVPSFLTLLLMCKLTRPRLERQYKSTSWSELVSSRNIVRVHVGIFAHLWAQYSGMNALMYYITYIFEMAGLTGTNNLTIASIQYVINCVMTIPALIFVDRLPRRMLMMAGSFFLGVWLFTTAGLMATYGHAVPGGLEHSPNVTWIVEDSAASKAIIACSYLFVATYALTWGPMGWIYPSEIIPLYIRSKAVSMATLANWAGNFSLTFFTPPAFENIQWRTYIVFGTICMVGFIHVFLFSQETTGRSLEEMNDIFDANTFAFGNVKEPERFSERVRRVEEQLDDGTGPKDNYTASVVGSTSRMV